VQGGALPAPAAKMLEATLLSDAAIDQRIDLVLAAVSQPVPARRAVAAAQAGTPRKKTRGKP
jgi:hypothetical protein